MNHKHDESAGPACPRVTDGYVHLPIVPTCELLSLLVVQRWPEDWEAGKALQMELGCSVVPPNTEMEIMAGVYKRLVDALRTQRLR